LSNPSDGWHQITHNKGVQSEYRTLREIHSRDVAPFGVREVGDFR
jgi:hypothetical protein